MTPQQRYSGEPLDAEIFDITRWPVVFVTFPQLDMPARTDRLLGGLSQLFSQQQRIALVWIPARHGHEREPHEDEKQSTRWMKQFKKELNTYCAGYVYLTNDPDVRTSLSSLFPKVQKIMPFPKTLAEDDEEAYVKAKAFVNMPRIDDAT